MRKVEVGVGALAADDVVRVAREGALVELSPQAREAIERSRACVEELAASNIHPLSRP